MIPANFLSGTNASQLAAGFIYFGITRSPSDAWVTQQLREATPFGEGPRVLICDNDGKFGDQFERVAEGSGIDVIHAPVEAPKANSICERFIGSVRRY